MLSKTLCVQNSTMKLKNWILKTLVSLLKPRRANQSAQKRFLVLSTTGLGDERYGAHRLFAH